MISGQPTADARELRPAAYIRDRRWVLRRIALGLCLVFTFAVGAALLTSAGIDPALDQASE